MTDSVKPTWYILGAGAIGCLWAAYFRRAEFPVVLISRTPDSQSTLTLNNSSGRHQVDVSFKSIKQLDQCIHYLMVSTKAQQTTDAIAEIKTHLAPDATVFVVQNGIATQHLPNQLPTQKLFAGVTTDGAYRTDKYTVTHAGAGQTLIDTLTPDRVTQGCTELIRQLPQNDLRIEYSEHFKEQQWKKLAMNCVINGLTAIYQCKNGEVLGIARARNTATVLCNETFKIIDALGIMIAKDAQALFKDVELACQLTADNYSSMYQDIKHQRPTEIDCLNGFLCKQAQHMSLPCPENQSIVDQIKQLEQAR
jgi:2-dehydropantoate 2-reductase